MAKSFRETVVQITQGTTAQVAPFNPERTSLIIAAGTTRDFYASTRRNPLTGQGYHIDNDSPLQFSHAEGFGGLVIAEWWVAVEAGAADGVVTVFEGFS